MSTTPRRSFGSIEKRGHSYRARYKRFGTWHSAPHQFTTKGAARQWLDGEKWLIDNDALGRGTWTPPAERAQQVKLKEQQDALTLVVWVQQHLDRLTEIKDSSRQTYQRYIDNRLIKPTSPAAQRFANTPITDITRTMVYDWWDAITEEFNTPSTNHKAHQLVRSAMEAAVERLKSGGRIGVITFHSLEDRIIKQTFAKLVKGCTCPPQLPVCVCGKKPILKKAGNMVPSAAEIEENPRSRSARLRYAIKI